MIKSNATSKQTKALRLLGFTLAIMLLGFIVSCSSKFYPYAPQRSVAVSQLSLSEYKLPHLRKGQDKNSVLAVSISGGGSRAMCFGIGVLLGLEEIKASNSNLLEEVDYFSTVSGGGFAAGYYLSRRYHYYSYDSAKVGPFSFNKIWNNSVERGSMLPSLNLSVRPLKNILIHNWLRPKGRIRQYYYAVKKDVMFTDEIDDIVPLGVSKKEGRKVYNRAIKELNHENYIDKLMLSHFYIPKDSNTELKLPILIPNGTVFQNNARMALVPYLFDSLCYMGLCKRTSLSGDKQMKKYNQCDMPLYYPITASAAFPGVLPQMRGERPGNEELRIIDGGVGDNFGYKSIFDVFNELNESNSYKKLKKRLIVIDASGIGAGSPYSRKEFLNIVKIAGRQLYSVLESKYPDALIEMNKRSDESFLYRHLGITTLANYAKTAQIPPILSGQKKVSWNELYECFLDYMKVKSNTQDINLIKPEQVSASKEALWVLYELSAHVETKLQVTDKEREILVLAGKTVVYLEKNELIKLLK